MSESLISDFLSKKLAYRLPFQISIIPGISPILTTVIIFAAILFIALFYIIRTIFSKVQKSVRKISWSLEPKPNRITKFVELHLHLDGSITLDIAKKLAKIQNINLYEKYNCKDDQELENHLSIPGDVADLNQFLQMFDIPVFLMQTPKGLTEAVRLVAENIRSQGVIYAEIRFAPQLHQKQGMNQEDAVKAALEGLKKTKLKANLILCLMRGDGNEDENEITLELARKYLVEDGGVVGLDIAGAEALYKTRKYEDIFRRAREYNIPFTIHAGEADGADSVRAAIEFGAKRIGHGVRSFEDPEVIQMIKDMGITLEMCPTSNRQTHAVDDMTQYPFRQYFDQEIKVTLNTDDMGIERTTLPLEYQYMEKYFGLTYEEEKILLLNSVNAAFTSDKVKQSLRKELGL